MKLLKTMIIAMFLVALAPLALGASWTGYVLDNSSSPIANATVASVNSSNSVTLNSTLTLASGFFNVSVPNSTTVRLFTSKAGYNNDTSQLLPGITSQTLLPFNITLTRALPGHLEGYVLATNSTPISGATVNVLLGSSTVATATTNASGYYLASNITDGTYTLSASAANYLTQNITNVVVYPNATTQSNFTLSVGGDSTAPIISSVSSSEITTDNARIKWTTDESANSTLRYGTSLSLGTTRTSATLVTSHRFDLNSLSSNTLYYYNVTSCDASSNCRTSGPYNFTTKKTKKKGGGNDDDNNNNNPFISTSTQTLDFKTQSSFTLKIDFSDILKILYKEVQHKLFVTKLSKDKVSMQLRSTPQLFDLVPGQSIDLDLDGDNLNDMRVTLTKINSKVSGASTSYEADMGFKLIDIPITTTTPAANQTQQNATADTSTEDEKPADDYEEATLSEGVKILSRKMPVKTKAAIAVVTIIILSLLYGLYRKNQDY